MAIENITKTEFQRLLKSVGDVTFKIVFDGDAWYEQLTDNEVAYLHKLLSFKELKSYDALSTKAKGANKSIDKTETGDVRVCVCDAAVYYYLVPEIKRERNEARKSAYSYAEMIAKMKSARPPRITRTVREAA